MVADEEGFGEVVADLEHRALLLRAVQKGAGRFGLRGDLKIEDADDAPFGKHLIAADVQVHFIFCTVGEEEGFLGSAGVLLLFLALIIRLIILAERQPFKFGRVYGYSVLSIFLFHVFINVGMVLGLTPVIGIPLPFFSYGGSSLWGFTILLFIFLRIDAGRNLVRT